MENKNKAVFGFGIVAAEQEDGTIIYKTQAMNQGIPIEIIAMRLKVLLKRLEDKYFDNFSPEFESF